MLSTYEIDDETAATLLDDSGEPPASTGGGAGGGKRGRGRPRVGGGSGARKRGSGAASGAGRSDTAAGARELARLLAQALGMATTVAALFVDLEAVALEPDEATAISRPLARIIARSGWAAWLMNYASDANNRDMAALVIALGSYGVRVYQAVAERNELRGAALANAAANQNFGTGATPYVVSRSAAAPVRPTETTSGQRSGGSGDVDAVPPTGSPADAARVAAIVGGAGLADADALTGGAYANVGAISRAYPAN